MSSVVTCLPTPYNLLDGWQAPGNDTLCTRQPASVNPLKQTFLGDLSSTLSDDPSKKVPLLHSQQCHTSLIPSAAQTALSEHAPDPITPSPLAAPLASTSTLPVSSAEVAAPIKRGRGRPKGSKNIKPEDRPPPKQPMMYDADGNPIGRKMGRPKKVSDI